MIKLKYIEGSRYRVNQINITRKHSLYVDIKTRLRVSQKKKLLEQILNRQVISFEVEKHKSI